MQHAAHSLRCRLAGGALVIGVFLALAASIAPASAEAASRAGCTFKTRSARIISLRSFKRELAPARATYFRQHRKLRARRAFVRGQGNRLSSLKHAVARCAPSNTNAAADSAPDPATTPCSPSLFSAPYTEMNEGTTNAKLPMPPSPRLSAVMLFVDFPDLHATGSTSDLFNRLIPRARAWYSEVSYGRMQLDVTPVSHWVRMPRNFQSYNFADGVSWRGQHDYIADAVAAADPGFDFSPYNVVYVVSPHGTHVERSPAFQSYPGDGIHADGKELRWGATFFEDVHGDPTYAANVLIHETGHILGLPDLYDVPNPVFWSLFRFAGGWDMMSWNDPGSHFLAWEKWKLGWLDPAQLTCVDGPSQLTTTITPLERKGGLKAVVVPTGLSSAYVIEARRRTGQDAPMCDEGILVYSVDASVRSGYGPVQIRPAQASSDGDKLSRCGPLYNAPYDSARGEVARFQDNAAGLTVQVLSSNAGGYRVRVTRTSLAAKGIPGNPGSIAAGGAVQEALAPPQAPLFGDPFPLGLGWNLSPDLAA